MKSVYKFIFDNGDIKYITAKTRKDAVGQYCVKCPGSKEWIRDHCKIVNMGIVKEDNYGSYRDF